MVIVKMGDSQIVFEPTTHQSAVLMLSLRETIKQKAEPYFERGYTAVTQGRKLRTFKEARDIIYNRIESAANDKFEDFLWDYAVIMARAYIAGVEAAQDRRWYRKLNCLLRTFPRLKDKNGNRSMKLVDWMRMESCGCGRAAAEMDGNA